jgi:hypothetical protein
MKRHDWVEVTEPDQSYFQCVFCNLKADPTHQPPPDHTCVDRDIDD